MLEIVAERLEATKDKDNDSTSHSVDSSLGL